MKAFAGLPFLYFIESKLTKLQVHDFPWTTGLFIISICPMMTSWLQYYISVWILNILVLLFALELCHFKIKISFHLLLWDTSVAISNHPQNVDGKFFTCPVDSLYQKRRGRGGRVITTQIEVLLCCLGAKSSEFKEIGLSPSCKFVIGDGIQ